MTKDIEYWFNQRKVPDILAAAKSVFGVHVENELGITFDSYVEKLRKTSTASLMKIGHLLCYYESKFAEINNDLKHLRDIRLILLLSAVEAVIGTNIQPRDTAIRIKEFYRNNLTKEEREQFASKVTFYSHNKMSAMTDPENVTKFTGAKFTKAINWIVDNRNDFLHRGELIRFNKPGVFTFIAHRISRKAGSVGYVATSFTVDELSVVSKKAIVRYLIDRKRKPNRDLRYRGKTKSREK